jgi:hypothetical protein
MSNLFSPNNKDEIFRAMFSGFAKPDQFALCSGLLMRKSRFVLFD